jgi:DNA-binding NtrC family response regulator
MSVKTILVVDDEDNVRRVTELLLQTDGYEVYTAASASEALAIANRLSCRLNLLLTDMHMPDMDGYDLIISVRKLCPYTDTLLMSGAIPADDARLKNYRVLAKPFTMQQLITVVRDIFDGQVF